jgi:hypothetical protein
MYAEGTIEEASPKYMAPDPIRRTPPWVFSKLNVRDAPVDTKQVLRHNLPPARPLSEIFGLSSYAAWEARWRKYARLKDIFGLKSIRP